MVALKSGGAAGRYSSDSWSHRTPTETISRHLEGNKKQLNLCSSKKEANMFGGEKRCSLDFPRVKVKLKAYSLFFPRWNVCVRGGELFLSFKIIHCFPIPADSFAMLYFTPFNSEVFFFFLHHKSHLCKYIKTDKVNIPLLKDKVKIPLLHFFCVGFDRMKVTFPRSVLETAYL